MKVKLASMELEYWQIYDGETHYYYEAELDLPEGLLEEYAKALTRFDELNDQIGGLVREVLEAERLRKEEERARAHLEYCK